MTRKDFVRDGRGADEWSDGRGQIFAKGVGPAHENETRRLTLRTCAKARTPPMKKAGELRLPRREGNKAEEALRGSVPFERANVRETSESGQCDPASPEGAC